MSLRVIQWATGGVGRAAIEAIVSHPELELVGVYVHSEAKAGRDAGEIVCCAPLSIETTHDIEPLLSLDADCVLYSPMIADRRELARILESGKNVVSPLNWFYQGNRDWSDLEDACAKGGVTLHGTGINPGGVTERFPLMISALSREVTHVRAEEWSDIRTYGAPAVIRDVMLFGKTPEEALGSPMVKLMGDGFRQSIDMVADELGFDLDPEHTAKHEVAAATKPIETPIGVIAPGHVAAQRFTWEGTVRGTPVITVRTNWFMGEDGFEDGFTMGPEGERFEVEICGDPSCKVTFEGWHPPSVEAGLKRNPGVVATAVHAVSAIPAVCSATQGIKSYLDLPLVAGRAAPALAR
jgi:hypothetical protein